MQSIPKDYDNESQNEKARGDPWKQWSILIMKLNH